MSDNFVSINSRHRSLMGLCCCCFRTTQRPFIPPPQRTRASNAAKPSRAQAPAAMPQPAPLLPQPSSPPPTTCNFCGITLDAALLEGHRESCRQRHREKMRVGTTEAKPPAPVEANESDDRCDCVICFDAPATYAILPCGHVVACDACIGNLSICPICRGERKRLYRFDPSSDMRSFRCKSCGHHVEPTVFHGHREVCALQMKLRAATESSHLLAT